MKKTINTFLIFLFLLVTVSLFISWSGKPPQPIKYNHKIHIEEAGLTCTDCHQYVEETPVAGLPTIEVCLECHEEALTENPEEAKLIKIANSSKKIFWHKVNIMPPDVYFSHRRHVGLAKIECEKCHGKMEQMTSPPQKPAINLSMKFCMNCHKEVEAENDCLACHL